jgi:hypothetical protein
LLALRQGLRELGHARSQHLGLFRQLVQTLRLGLDAAVSLVELLLVRSAELLQLSLGSPLLLELLLETGDLFLGLALIFAELLELGLRLVSAFIGRGRA